MYIKYPSNRMYKELLKYIGELDVYYDQDNIFTASHLISITDEQFQELPSNISRKLKVAKRIPINLAKCWR